MLQIIQASAGSGKTYTLVKEYLWLALQKPGNFKHILAITFTNKAAAEMKERVLLFLNQIISGENELLTNELCSRLKIQEQELKIRATGCLTDILHHYSDFGISTIDSFVHKIVSAFSWDLKLPMGFKAEIDSELLIENLTELLFNQITPENKNLSKNVIEFTEYNLEDKGNWKTDSSIKSIANQLLREEATVFLPALAAYSSEDFDALRKKITSISKEFEDEISNLSLLALKKIENAGLKKSDFSYGTVVSYFEKLQDKNYEDVKAEKSRSQDAFFNNKWYKKDIAPEIKSCIENVMPDILSYFYKILHFYNEKKSLYFVCKILKANMYTISLLSDLSNLLNEHRKLTHSVHISEFQKRIHEIVKDQDAPIIYERIGEKYHHIMIDEFQDTSVLQWQNLLPLIENAQIERGNSLIVGDGKQAIYRFRSGNVHQFACLPKILNAENNDRLLERENNVILNGTEKKYLKKNYRSLPEIIQFNNEFYNTLKNNAQFLAETEIYKEHEQEIVKKEPEGFVQVSFFKKEKEDKDEEGNSIFENKINQKLIEIIFNLTNKGFKPNDIAILTQRNKTIPQLTSFLLNNGLSVSSPDSLLLCSELKIQILEGLLRLQLYPKDEILRLTVFQQLKRLTNLKTDFTKENNSDSLFQLEEKIKILFPSFEGFNKYASLHLYDACLEYVSVFKMETKPDIFIENFLEIVLKYCIDNNPYNSRLFLEWWEEEKPKRFIQVPESEEAIRIMTIHKSKGLQFPVVILPECFNNFSSSLNKKLFWTSNIHEELAPFNVLLLTDRKDIKETEYAPLSEAEKMETRLDALNLLYVATTRPEEQLYIFTKITEKETEEPNNFANFFNHLTWHPNFMKEEMIWESGNNNYIKSNVVKKEKNNMLSLSNFAVTSKPIKTKVDRSEDLYWNADRREKVEFGNLLHDILSHSHTLEQFSIIIDKYKNDKGIPEEICNRLFESGKFIFESNELGYLNSEDWEIIDERSFLHNTKLRPDRIYLNEKTNKAVIVDYKTGKPNTEYNLQILKYKYLLTQSGFSNIRCWLIYTDEQKMEEVI